MKLKIITLIIAAALLTGVFTARIMAGKIIYPPIKTVTLDRGINKVVNESPFDIVILSGEPKLTVTGDSRMAEYVGVEIKNKELRIYQSKNNPKKSNGEVTIQISMPELTELWNMGAGDMNVTNMRSEGTCDLLGFGSGDIVIANINATRARISSHGAGDIGISGIDAKSLEVLVSGAGDLSVVRAETEQADIQLNGAGDITIMKLKGQSVYVVLNGAGDIKLGGSSDMLHAILNGAGDIDLSNFNPRSLSTVINGAGDISK